MVATHTLMEPAEEKVIVDIPAAATGSKPLVTIRGGIISQQSPCKRISSSVESTHEVTCVQLEVYCLKLLTIIYGICWGGDQGDQYRAEH